MIRRVTIYKTAPDNSARGPKPYGTEYMVDPDLQHAIGEAHYHNGHLHEVDGGYVVCGANTKCRILAHKRS